MLQQPAPGGMTPQPTLTAASQALNLDLAKLLFNLQQLIDAQQHQHQHQHQHQVADDGSKAMRTATSAVDDLFRASAQTAAKFKDMAFVRNSRQLKGTAPRHRQWWAAPDAWMQGARATSELAPHVLFPDEQVSA